MLTSTSLDFPAAVPELRAGSCARAEQQVPRAGAGRLEITRVHGRSALIGCTASSPLQLLSPRPRGEAVWVVAASHGGGLVAGDAVELEVSVGEGATACLGTQAETKVYRAAGARGASQRMRASVSTGALLAVLPDPVSPFTGSRYHQVQRFELAAGASLAVLDAVTAGRSARGERWAPARYRSRNEILLAERLILADAIRLDADEGPAPARRLAGWELLAVVILVGPRVAGAARTLLHSVAGAPATGEGPVLTSASPLADGLLLRLAARSVEAGMAALRSHLSFLAEPLDGDPLLRRP